MSSAVSGLRKGTRLCGALVCFLLVLPLACAAQGRAQRDPLPRVGTIKDYPATGLTVGCGNYYFYLAHQAMSPEAAYVFIARGNGDNAWMNLDGRDVRLTRIKVAPRAKRKTQPFFYRLGRLRISVSLDDSKPETAAPVEDDNPLKMSITLRKGRMVRTVHAVGSSDC